MVVIDGVLYKCSWHPKYKAMKKPTSECIDCARLFLLKEHHQHYDYSLNKAFYMRVYK